MKDEARGRMMSSKSEEGNGGDHPTGFDFDLVNKNTKTSHKRKKSQPKSPKSPPTDQARSSSHHHQSPATSR